MTHGMSDKRAGRQSGVTFIGWLFLLTPLAILIYAGIRVWPVYYNYMKVGRTLEQVASEFQGGDGANAQSLRNSIEKHFEVENVETPASKDIKITREGRAWVMEAEYEEAAPLLANVALTVSFDKTVRVGGGGGGD